MKIEKGIVTAAGPNQTRLAVQRFFDSDGREKPALRIIADEVFSTGIKELIVVIRPDTLTGYQEAIGRENLNRVVFVEQAQPRGYADALLRGADLLGAGPFLHLVGDHLYISGDTRRGCAQQLVDCAEVENCAVSAVQATPERLLRYYGAIGGQRVDSGRLVEVERVLEKPTPTVAEQELQVPGVRSGKYLCFFGMHVLTPAVFEILRTMEAQSGTLPSLSQALDELARRERYLAMELKGTRYDLGIPYGTLMTQLALALAGVDRDSVLSQLVELLAQSRPMAADKSGTD